MDAISDALATKIESCQDIVESTTSPSRQPKKNLLRKSGSPFERSVSSCRQDKPFPSPALSLLHSCSDESRLSISSSTAQKRLSEDGISLTPSSCSSTSTKDDVAMKRYSHKRSRSSIGMKPSIMPNIRLSNPFAAKGNAKERKVRLTPKSNQHVAAAQV